jgi:hypothetical protein
MYRCTFLDLGTSTHLIGGWVGTRAGLDVVEIILDPTGTRIPTMVLGSSSYCVVLSML